MLRTREWRTNCGDCYSIDFTKSRSPSEAPPVVTSMSTLCLCRQDPQRLMLPCSQSPPRLECKLCFQALLTRTRERSVSGEDHVTTALTNFPFVVQHFHWFELIS